MAKTPAKNAERQHKATYSRDKRNGGYIVRVAGAHSGKFVGRTVPVEKRDGTETPEKLTALIWTGVDTETKEPVTLYKFEPTPRDAEQDEIPF